MSKKQFFAIISAFPIIMLLSCTKEKTSADDNNNGGTQFPTSGILYKGDTHIFIMNVDGTNSRKLSLSTHNYAEDYPSSSPDGKKIVFRRYGQGIITQDATGEKVILNDVNSPLFPTWADNSKIYYSRYTAKVSNAKQYVYSINADGSGEAQVSPNHNDVTDPLDYQPSVSPDKAYIVFSTNRFGNGGTLMKIKLSDGTISYLNYTGNTLGETVICPAEHPTWSPNGAKIAFSAYPGYPDFSQKEQIYVMNQDGSGKVRLTNETAAACQWPSWSPDGTKIVFQKVYPGFANSNEIWIMNADGTGAKALTDRMKTGWEMNPCFIGKPR
jgi:dipeptidyl aminopeptidase/acylaminoacyl peptidase